MTMDFFVDALFVIDKVHAKGHTKCALCSSFSSNVNSRESIPVPQTVAMAALIVFVNQSVACLKTAQLSMVCCFAPSSPV